MSKRILRYSGLGLAVLTAGAIAACSSDNTGTPGSGGSSAGAKSGGAGGASAGTPGVAGVEGTVGCALPDIDLRRIDSGGCKRLPEQG